MRKRNRLFCLLAIIPLLLATACGSDSSSSQQGYSETKSIVLDVLKSEEAEKAIEEAMKKNQDKTMSLLSTGEGQQIQMAVKDFLTNEEVGVKLLDKTMKDPKFASDFAKALQNNMQQLHKDLMKDPEYQKEMLSLMENPEFTEIITKTLQTQKVRQIMSETVKEALQSPTLKGELITLFQKAIEEQAKQMEEQQQKGQEGKQEKQQSSEGSEDSGEQGRGDQGGSS